MNRSKGPEEEEGRRVCPYCEEEIRMVGLTYCQPCGVFLRYCVKCQIAVVREATICPQCGGELEWK